MRTIIGWILTCTAIGIASGLAAIALSLVARLLANITIDHRWLIWLLPAAGACTVGLYRALRIDWGMSTNGVIQSARDSKRVTGRLAPAIFLGTSLTLTCAGSVGKEAAALQMGASLGSSIGRVVNKYCGACGSEGLFIYMGMAAAFSALMQAPLAATLFVLEITCAHISIKTIAPTLVCAFIGYGLTVITGVCPPWIGLVRTASLATSLWATLLITGACAIVGVIFCQCLRGLKTGETHVLRGSLIRVVIGSIAASLLGWILPGNLYMGTGETLMSAAFMGAVPLGAFAAKAALTLLALGCGLKGGEIMPVMSIGAALGCAIGVLVGVNPAGCASVGLIAMLAACTNAPLASALLGVEAFGPSLGLLYLLAAVCAYLATFKFGLYTSNLMTSYADIIASIRTRFSHKHPL